MAGITKTENMEEINNIVVKFVFSTLWVSQFWVRTIIEYKRLQPLVFYTLFSPSEVPRDVKPGYQLRFEGI
jgi:hypothetical protein